MAGDAAFTAFSRRSKPNPAAYLAMGALCRKAPDPQGLQHPTEGAAAFLLAHACQAADRAIKSASRAVAAHHVQAWPGDDAGMGRRARAQQRAARNGDVAAAASDMPIA